MTINNIQMRKYIRKRRRQEKDWENGGDMKIEGDMRSIRKKKVKKKMEKLS